MINGKILDEYQYTKAEIEDLEHRIQKLEYEIFKLSKDRVVDRVQAGDIRTGHMKIEGIAVERISIAREQLERNRMILECRKSKLLEERCDVEEFIGTIEDSRARRICEYRYIDALSWAGVARKMGPGYTDESCRIYLTRYFNNEIVNNKIEQIENNRTRKYFRGNA